MLPGGPRARPAHRGFTLLELLITITIIGILASLALGALAISQERAREARTRAIITRLDQAVMARWESYRTRRLPIDPRALAVANTLDPNNSVVLGTIRLQALRELIRLELPEKWDDITTDPEPLLLMPRPALSLAYQRVYDAAVAAGNTPTTQYQNAECLYLIVTMGALDEDASTLDTFRHEDAEDADGDGMPEFHDGWGQPIRFQRWVPGFVSDLQPDADPATVDDPTTPEVENLERDLINNHDPLDPLRLDNPGAPPNSPTNLFDGFRVDASAFAGFRLFPLIYSAGSDGQVDLRDSFIDFGVTGPLNDPYFDPDPSITTGEKWLGAPHDFDGDGLNHLDNIHNHQLGDITR